MRAPPCRSAYVSDCHGDSGCVGGRLHWCRRRSKRGVCCLLAVTTVALLLMMLACDALMSRDDRVHVDVTWVDCAPVVQSVDTSSVGSRQSSLVNYSYSQRSSVEPTTTTIRATAVVGGSTRLDALVSRVLGVTTPLPAVPAKRAATRRLPGLERRVTDSLRRAGVPSSRLRPTSTTTASARQLCPLVPLNLVGRVAVADTVPSWSELCRSAAALRLRPGGLYHPPDCEARHRVAIIVPYRDRDSHLRTFLSHLHPVLQRQQLDYAIYVVKQAGGDSFNRAMLMNVGVVEALKRANYACFVFHDVDLLPEDDRNLYSCPQQPRHMSVAVDRLQYKLPYRMLFGGVSAMLRSHFMQVNGFSNRYWGWGGEDDDMSNRISFHHLFISRYPADVARYHMLYHEHAHSNPTRFQLLRSSLRRFADDGLTSLKYTLHNCTLHRLYTSLLVRLHKPV